MTYPIDDENLFHHYMYRWASDLVDEKDLQEDDPDIEKDRGGVIRFYGQKVSMIKFEFHSEKARQDFAYKDKNPEYLKL